MFNSLYDTDTITWNPKGRVLQIEYAMEAVKQGSPVVGLRSEKHAVLVAFKRRMSELAYHQNKIFGLDDHLGVAISGLTADGRELTKYLRTECLNHKYVYNTPINTGRLIAQLADKSQQNTQRSSGRPYGVGLIVAGCDGTGPHIFETSPSGDFYEYNAYSIGERNQAARTYLEKHLASFAKLERDDLIKDGVKALAATMADKDLQLTNENVSVAVVGVQEDFKLLTDDEVAHYLQEAGVNNPDSADVPMAD